MEENAAKRQLDEAEIRCYNMSAVVITKYQPWSWMERVLLCGKQLGGR